MDLSARLADQPAVLLFDEVVFGSRQGLFRLHEGALRWKFPAGSGIMNYRSAPVFDQTGTISVPPAARAICRGYG